MARNSLQENMLATYTSLRLGMAAIAAATPIIVVLWGKLFDVDWQASISAYYFAPRGNQWEYSYYPCRVFFVGILFALGTFLYLYKGLSKSENRALNIAGLCAIGVALCPMYAEKNYIPFSNYAHFMFAFVLFLCMAYTAVFCSESSLKYLTDQQLRSTLRRIYHIIAILMIFFPALGIVLAGIFQVQTDRVYWIEAVGIWTFAAYWAVKSWELWKSEADEKVMEGAAPAV
jgi:hypothetical protein